MKFNKPLAKPASDGQVLGTHGTEDRSVLDVHEDLSIGVTTQLAAKVGLYKRFNGKKHISKAIDNLFSDLSKTEKIQLIICRDWHLIVDSEIAPHSKPKSISFYKDNSVGGVLLIAAQNSSIGFMIKAKEHIIIERFTTYFGYKAIASLRIVISNQNFAKQEAKVLPKKISLHEGEHLKQALASIIDEDLKQSMEGLCVTLYCETS